MPTTLNSPTTGIVQYNQSIREVADLMGIPAGAILHAYTRDIGDPDGSTLTIILTPS